MKSKSANISICIVNWNACLELQQCLESIYKFSENDKIEIFVVDNASTDNSIEMVENCFPDVVLIKNKKNVGFSKANNMAIRRCKGDYVLFLNPDIVLLEPCFKKMISFIETNPEVGVVGCKLININGLYQKSFYQNFPSPLQDLIQGLMFYKITNIILENRRQINHSIEVAAIVGACMFIRRSVLDILKGFDERFFLYSEDVDLCYRINKNKLKIYYLGNIKMLHYHGACTKKAFLFNPDIQYLESRYILYKKHYGLFEALSFRLIWIICSIFRISIIILPLLFSLSIFKKYKKKCYYLMSKYYKNFLWAIGLEKCYNTKLE